MSSTDSEGFNWEDSIHRTESIVYWPPLRTLPTHMLNTNLRFYHLDVFNKKETSALLLTSGNRAYALGGNQWGQLGVEHGTDVASPTELEELRGKRVKAIDSGDGHVMALTNSGDVYGWGWNFYGQVGCGTKQDQTRPVLVRRAVQSVRCGKRHTAALDRDGSVWCCGWNNYAQLGCASEKNKKKFAPVKALPPVKSVECGNFNCVILTEQDQIYGWGEFSLGMKNKVILRNPTLLAMPFHLTGITALALSYDYMLILSRSQTVHRWHYDDKQNPHIEPIEVGEPVRAVVSNRRRYKVCLVTVSGRVIVWQGSGEVIHTSLTSVPDAFALYAHYADTPSLISLPPSAIEPRLLQSIRYFHNPAMSDLKLIIDTNNHIYLNRSHLAQRSEYLKKQTKGQWSDKRQVRINSYPYWVYWAYLRYVLCDVFEAETDWVRELLQLAIEYGEHRLEQICLNYMNNKLTTINTQSEMMPSTKVPPWSDHTQTDAPDLWYDIESLFKSTYRDEITMSTPDLGAPQRGYCLVINYDTFDDSSENRPGSQSDVRALRYLFTNFFNFVYDLHENLTFEETKQLLECISVQDFSSHDLFVLCLLSHGSLNSFDCKDKKASIPIDGIFARVDSNKTIAGKHKFFLISKCQGNYVNQGIRVSSSSNDSHSTDSSITHRIVPRFSNMLIFNSTYRGYVSYRDESQGTLFIQTFCQLALKLCNQRKCNAYDLCVIVTRILSAFKLKQSGNKCCQQASFESTLHSQFVLGPGQLVAYNVSNHNDDDIHPCTPMQSAMLHTEQQRELTKNEPKSSVIAKDDSIDSNLTDNKKMIATEANGITRASNVASQSHNSISSLQLMLIGGAILVFLAVFIQVVAILQYFA